MALNSKSKLLNFLTYFKEFFALTFFCFYIHRDSNQLTMPEVKRVFILGLNISLKGRMNYIENQEKIKPLLQLTFYLLDKIRRFKLSKDVIFSKVIIV